MSTPLVIAMTDKAAVPSNLFLGFEGPKIAWIVFFREGPNSIGCCNC